MYNINMSDALNWVSIVYTSFIEEMLFRKKERGFRCLNANER